MNTKLTLTLEKAVIEQAKKYASDKGSSLSAMVENYFRYLTAYRGEDSTMEVSSRIQKLRGIMKVGEEFDYKKVLAAERMKKYGS